MSDQKNQLDIPGRFQALSDELGKSTGTLETPFPPYKWKPFHQELEFSLGDRISWSDHFVETLQPNVYTPARTLSGEIVHGYAGRWGWGIRLRVLSAPDGDPLKPGDVVMRWDTMFHNVKPVLDA